MTGLANLLRSRKAVLSLLAMACVTLLAALGRITGELAVGVIGGLAGLYSAAQAYEDRGIKRAERAAVVLAELAKKSGAALAVCAALSSLVVGCGAGQSAREPCSEANLGAVVAFCTARAKAECGSQSYEQCARAKEIETECGEQIDAACGTN